MKLRSTVVLSGFFAFIILSGQLRTSGDEKRVLPNPQVREPVPAKPIAPSGIHPEGSAYNLILTSKTHRLENIDASDVAKAINTSMQAESKTPVQVNGSIVTGSLVLIPDFRTNSLTVVTTADRHARISKQIKDLDGPRTQVVVQCLVTQRTPDGKTDVLSRPQIRTLDGQLASLQIGSRDELLEFSVLPRVIQGTNPLPQVELQCTFAKKSVGSKIDILTQPQVLALSGQTSTLKIKSKQNEEFEVSLTARVIQPKR